MTELSISGRVDAARRELPFAVQKLTQFVVDNPAQVVLLGAGTIVACMAARTITRPRTVLEALALQAVLTAAAPLAAKQVIDRGWLTFRIRDADGALVTARPAKEG
jgi:hypothetical protein